MCVVHCCVCVCLSCDTHCFSRMGITECHVQLRSQLAPSQKVGHSMVPDTDNLLGSNGVRCSRADCVITQTAVLPHLHGEGPE